VRRTARGPFIALTLVAALAALPACSDDDTSPSGSEETTGDHETSPTTEPAGGHTVRVVTVERNGPGPDESDGVEVLQHGSEDAKNVLVLVPGTSAGAAYFTPLAFDIVDALPDWQVWSVDRRENTLEDHSMRERYVAGDATPQQLFDYYLGWIGNPAITDHFEPRGGTTSDDASVDYARQWGMGVAIDDLDAVVDEAVALGGEVVLGGHSLGGSITVAYATWDFGGRAGADDLSGIVLIDGGSGAGNAPSVQEAQAQLADLETGSPFNDIVGLGLPWASGVFNALGSTAALLAPDDPSIGWRSPLIPENLKSPMQPTNAAQYGYALDVDTSPDGLELVQMHLGSLAETGSPRGWVDDEDATVERAATMFSGIDPAGDVIGGGIDGTAWYHPRRLSLDSAAVNGGIANPAQDVLGVRATHGAELAIPIYALETQFGAGRVLAGARSLAEQAGVPDEDVTLVDESDALTHTDPMAVRTERNPLVDTLVPFLSAIG
jgi:pimeloyl-ACP methyl ester carboxylesterase